MEKEKYLKKVKLIRDDLIKDLVSERRTFNACMDSRLAEFCNHVIEKLEERFNDGMFDEQ